MLALTLMLWLGPIDQVPARSLWSPPSGIGGRTTDLQVVRPDGSTLRFQSGRCAPLLHHVAPSGHPTVVTRSGTYSVTPPANEERIKMYHLLERTIDGCRVPVIAIDHLPQADQAIGRTFGGPARPR